VKTPPALQAIDRKFGGVGGYSYRHVSGIVGDIVDSERNRQTPSMACKICISLYWLSPPTLPLLSVVSDELLLFCVDADDRESFAKELSLRCSDVSELIVALRMLGSGLLLFVDLQRIAHLAQ
jgi:hypothetical protein